MTLFTPAPFSFCLPNGEWLYQNIQLSIESGLTALTGRNGSGKSVLARQLQQRLSQACYLLPQLPPGDWQQRCVADMLGIADKLNALQALAAGQCTPEVLDTIGEHWQLAEDLCTELTRINARGDCWQSCSELSGGQLNCLRLWWVFYQRTQLLILDEPSNHLDSAGRDWLSQQLTAYLAKPKSAILLISHDRELLQQAKVLYELSALGLTRYGGNYDFYQQQRALEQSAALQQREQAERRLQQQQRKAETAAERAAKRQRQGEKRRGSQATVLLDYHKNRAQSATSARRTQELNHLKQTQQQVEAAKARQELVKPQHLHINTPTASSTKSLVNAVELTLARGHCAPLTFHWRSDARVHLQGCNGSGKSTLLQTLAGMLAPASGQLHVKGQCQYLDQHFSLLELRLSVLENLRAYCPALTETAARTLLASVGFRADKALKPCAVLSGGERMKLAVLMVSQHSDCLLLLDEPDNHLDLESKQLLVDALRDYPAGFVVVSHDQHYVSQLHINAVLELTP